MTRISTEHDDERPTAHRRGRILLVVGALVCAAAIAGGAVSISYAFSAQQGSTVLDTDPVVGPRSGATVPSVGEPSQDPSRPGDPTAPADPASPADSDPSDPSQLGDPVPVDPAPAAPAPAVPQAPDSDEDDDDLDDDDLEGDDDLDDD